MPTQLQDNLSITERLRQLHLAGVTLALGAARTVIVFQREKAGFRILSPGALGITTLGLYGIEAISNFHISIPMVGRFGSAHPTESLSNFALAVAGVGLWQRRQRLNELRNGKRWHTRSLGISRLEFLPIRKDWIYVWIDPAITVVAGLCLRKLGFSGLGLWIVFSGLCLHIVEQFRRSRQLESDLDGLDSQIESENAAEIAAHFDGGSTGRSLRDTAGTPTGADDSLQAVIARRKAGVK